MIDATNPDAPIRIGYAKFSGEPISAAISNDAKIVTMYDSYTSEPMPAASPTLSPTLSAIVAGFRGSSSGMFASTFPTKSAPMSAAFVKIPPPILMNNAIRLAPIPIPAIVIGFG